MDHATSATTPQPRNEATDLNVAAQEEDIIDLTSTNMELLLSGHVKTKHGPTLMKEDVPVGSLRDKTPTPKDKEQKVGFSLVMIEWLEKDTTGMLLKHKDSWSGSSSTIKATNRTIHIKGGTFPVCQQSYCARQRSREVVYEHMEKQLKADVMERVQSRASSCIVLDNKRTVLLNLVCTTGASMPPPYHIPTRYLVWMIPQTA